MTAPSSLPRGTAGAVTAELTFRNGTLLSISAAALAIAREGEPRFVESFAC